MHLVKFPGSNKVVKKKKVAEKLVPTVTSCQKTSTTAEVARAGFGERRLGCLLQDLMRGKTDLRHV